MVKLTIIACTGLFLAAPVVADEEGSNCARTPLRAGECFTVHGRLTTCTGIPNARIWIIGTKRILGVMDAKGHPNGDHLLPQGLEDEMFSATPCSKAAYGDFTVCPLTPSQPGLMQEVCVVSAAKVSLRER